ncbi:MAG: hypothetical protein QW508_06635 [Conexivisphaerales archaeon]
MYVEAQQIRLNALNFISGLVTDKCKKMPLHVMTPEYFEKLKKRIPVLQIRKEFGYSEIHELIDAVLNTYIEQSKSGNRLKRTKFVMENMQDQYKDMLTLKDSVK